jgi:hypothetical protein
MKRKSARAERRFALLNGHVFRLRTLLAGTIAGAPDAYL